MLKQVVDEATFRGREFWGHDPFRAACEVALGLKAPEIFERRQQSGPEHFDMLTDRWDGDIPESTGEVVALPPEVLRWVKAHPRLDPTSFLKRARGILGQMVEDSPRMASSFYSEDSFREWSAYLADLHARVVAETTRGH